MRHDLESSKRNHQLFQWMGMSFQEHSHAFATQQRRGFQLFLSTVNSKAVGRVLEVEVFNQLGGIRRTISTHFVIFRIRTLALKKLKEMLESEWMEIQAHLHISAD